MDDSKLQEIRSLFENDRFATEAGCTIESIDNGTVRCSMEISDRHLNAHGFVMGGAIYTLADFTFAVATNWEGNRTVTLCADSSFLKQPRSRKITASSVIIHNGRTTCNVRISVTDTIGNQVAEFVFTGMHVRLSPIE